MRKVKVMLKWIVISIVLQIAVLTYFNYVYLPSRNKVSVTVFKETDGKESGKEISLPSNAYGIKVSYNGKYMGYLMDNNLYIIDISDGKKAKTISFPRDYPFYYRWLPDRDMIIYSAGSTGEDGVLIQTYDLSTGHERTYPKIAGILSESEVLDIELSTLTNVVYVKVKIDSSKAKVYKFDIMDKLKFVMEIDSNTVIKELNYTDSIVYQDTRRKLNMINGSSNKIFPVGFEADIVLLDVDSNDNVFAGEIGEKGQIKAIHYGKLNSASAVSWNTIELKAYLNAEDIIISPEGNIFAVVEQASALLGITDDTKVAVKGELVEILKDYVVIKNNKTVTLLAR